MNKLLNCIVNDEKIEVYPNLFCNTNTDVMLAFVKEKGIDIHSGPFQPNSHIKFFYVMDPNGLKIQFVENI